MAKKMKKKSTMKTKPLKKIPKTKRGDEQIVIKGKYGCLATKDGRHVEERYIITKKKGKGGKITIEMTPNNKLQERRKELVEKLSPTLGKGINNKALMKDILNDIGIDALEKMNTAIDRGAKVEPREGCFYLSIKDPRRKKPYHLHMRE